MTGRTRRLLAIGLVGVLVAGLVTAGALSALRRAGPVSIVEPSPSTREAARVCADLVRALPEVVDGHGPRSTRPASPYVGAWGRPAIVLFCGAGVPPELTPTSELVTVNDVDWLPVEEDSAWRFTTVGRVVNVQVLVPKEYEQPVNALVDLAAPIGINVPRFDTMGQSNGHHRTGITVVTSMATPGVVRRRPEERQGRNEAMTVQLTITLPTEVVESVRRAVAEGRAASESDYIADSIAMRERLENLQDVLAEWDPAASQS